MLKNDLPPILSPDEWRALDSPRRALQLISSGEEIEVWLKTMETRCMSNNCSNREPLSTGK